ncbi:Chibby family [Plasmodiophora brassicae]|uniref:Uncharacterized protein n=1 Tax=Plasmodiophora brassicae TaxID=37360 RepID=A0A0G4IRZ8_PLABS|nr:hypothetical protein PBRA_006000 [Plasmodiophora brassicae]SPQ98101.1 unnamed protein product [Plasmodiophora brassicae]
MKFLWNKARASQGGNSADLLGDTPFENDLRLGKHHLKLVDGEWVLLSSSAGASDAPNMGAVLEENQRLKAQVADLERANHRLTFKNKLLIAMCTISEGDRRVAEMENEQLLKDAGKAPPAHKP